MSKILTINGSGLENFGRGSLRGAKKNSALGRVVLGMKQRSNIARHCEKSAGSNFKRIISLLIFAVVFFGCYHIYQINDLATKGYEVKEIENQIAELKKFNEKSKIKEVELKSMYNIEKEISDLNLVASTNTIYLNTSGPMAMK